MAKPTISLASPAVRLGKMIVAQVLEADAPRFSINRKQQRTSISQVICSAYQNGLLTFQTRFEAHAYQKSF